LLIEAFYPLYSFLTTRFMPGSKWGDLCRGAVEMGAIEKQHPLKR